MAGQEAAARVAECGAAGRLVAGRVAGCAEGLAAEVKAGVLTEASPAAGLLAVRGSLAAPCPAEMAAPLAAMAEGTGTASAAASNRCIPEGS